jgi:mRNA interferase HigB
MRIYARETLEAFWENHSDSKSALEVWYREVKNSIWETPNDILNRYSFASVLTGNRVKFNIKGNRYRLVVKINYNKKIVFIKFVGTHAEYDKINAETIE